MIYLDFETRSTCSLKNCGAWVYSEHPTTSVLCMAYAYDDGPVRLWTPAEAIDEELARRVQTELVEAHNSFFERAIWKNIMVARMGWPEIPHENWRCSAAKASAHALPRFLSGVGAALHLAVQKDEEGRRTMLKLAKPRKPTKNNPSIWHSNPEDYKALMEYCVTDVESERAVSHALRDLHPFEQRLWFLDQKINMRGVYIDAPAVLNALYLIDKYTDRLSHRLRWITGGKVTSASEVAKLSDWFRSKGLRLENLQKNTITECLERDDLSEDVREALLIRQQMSMSSTSKYKRMLEARSRNGRVKDILMYHGAGTGRWTGKIVQLQNLPKGTIKDVDSAIELMAHRDLDLFEMIYSDVMGAISSCIRGMITAAPGNILYVGDYKAIEARVLAWLAGAQRMLHLFRTGEDTYVDLAKNIYGVAEVSKEQRDLGKRGVLGAGYGMGWQKFKDTCKDQGGLEISEDMAQRAIDTYRNTHHEVPEYWNLAERAAIQAFRSGKPVKCRAVTYFMHQKFLFCKLPSGRCIAYYEPKLLYMETPWGDRKWTLTYMGVNSQTRKWRREKTYGGKLVENITQAVARDILAHALLNLEAKKYFPIDTVHDEAVSETKENFGTLEEFLSIMTDIPEWAEGCPVEAEGYRAKRYRK